jgi:ribonuclease HII
MLVIGVDEVGLGPAFGPVVACAYHPFPSTLKKLEELLEWGKSEGKDSKLRSPKQRAALIPLLKQYGDYKISCGTVQEINTLNIHKASLLAMKRAVEGLRSRVKSDRILVDGKNLIPGVDRRLQSAVIKGDCRVVAIACASIIAKEFRDAFIVRLASWPQFSVYGLEIHKGYTTSAKKGEPGKHELAIARYGATPLHHLNNKAVIRAQNKFLGLDIAPVLLDNQFTTKTESQLCLQLQQLSLNLG